MAIWTIVAFGIRKVLGNKKSALLGVILIVAIVGGGILVDWGEMVSNIKNHRTPPAPHRINIELCEQKPNFEWDGDYLVETLEADVKITAIKDGILHREKVYYVYADVVGEGVNIEICLDESTYEELYEKYGNHFSSGAVCRLKRKVYYSKDGWSQETVDDILNVND